MSKNISKQAKLSTINIPVAISVTKLEGILNKQVSGLVFKEEIKQVRDLFVEVHKTDTIRLKLVGQVMNYEIPLNIEVIKKTLFGKIKGEGSVRLLFKTALDIESDWNLKTKTQLKDVDWLSRPVLKVAGIEIPIQSILEQLLERMKGRIEDTIDQQIRERLPMRKQVNQAWKMIQQPVLVSPEYRAWLLIRPQSIGMKPLLTADNMVNSTIHIGAFSEIFVGQKPEFESNDTLPQLQIGEFDDNEFSVSVKTGISYQAATKQVNDLVKGETFTQAGQTVVIEQVNIQGAATDLIVKARLSGDFNGVVELTGKPYFDTTTQRVQVENLEFEVNTKNVIHKSAAWLFKNELVKLIEQSLSFPIDEKIEEVRSIANEKLQGHELNEHVSLQGHIEAMTIDETYLSERGITVLLSGKGQLKVFLK